MFVTTLCYAKNKTEFRKQAQMKLLDLGLQFDRLEDVEVVAKRLKTFNIDDKLLQLIPTISLDNSIVFGTFHTYD